MEIPLPLRWHATVYYRTDQGMVEVEHDCEELEELHDLIERGPNWNTIDRIVVVLALQVYPGLTIEQSEQL
jgi:hypothetical protein